ncbi:hypothetical protein CYY_007967 [Polysphondylium violaceum]|uniref:Complex 1 LYR protein domain-containing protein n=1 Tax=Polysphondylium violaceum TaxID=133409 RepID=A0A8J4PNL1_9MYCE|nr:hypothetical protein CYY_007967 [Polysphondylium violaceum]
MTTQSSMVLFRRLLREGHRYQEYHHNHWWRNQITATFRENRDVKDPNEIKRLQDIARAYRYNIKSSRDLSELLDSYNIGIASRARIEKSSQRVGLKVPEWPEDRDKRIKERKEKEAQDQNNNSNSN